MRTYRLGMPIIPRVGKQIKYVREVHVFARFAGAGDNAAIAARVSPNAL